MKSFTQFSRDFMSKWISFQVGNVSESVGSLSWDQKGFRFDEKRKRPDFFFFFLNSARVVSEHII